MSEDAKPVEFECIGGPLDGQYRPRPPFFYEPYHDKTTMIDEASGESYSLRWTASSSVWQWNGMRDVRQIGDPLP